MLRKKIKRSREHKMNSQVIDIEEARERRRRNLEEKKAKNQEQAMKEMEKKPSKRKKKQIAKRRFVYLFCTLIILGLLYYGVHDILDLQKQKSELEQEQQALADERAALEEELKNVNDPKYIEQQARQKLKLIMPDEILFILPQQEEQNQNQNHSEEQNATE